MEITFNNVTYKENVRTPLEKNIFKKIFPTHLQVEKFTQ